jgi:ribonuclease PH
VIELVQLATSKVIVVSLAVIGAGLTTLARGIAGAVVAVLGFGRVQNPKAVRNKITKILVWLGYAAMSLSVFLFIVSGFIVDLF